MSAEEPLAFISYRREDSAWPAGRIRDHLVLAFGSEAVFKDTASIRPGDDFGSDIERVVASAFIVLVVMGRNWVGERPDGTRRIDDEADYVRMEVEVAIQRRAKIIPLLIDESKIPELPRELRALRRFQSLRIRQDPDFRGDLTVLLTQLRRIVPERFRPGIDERVRQVQPEAFGERTLAGLTNNQVVPSGDDDEANERQLGWLDSEGNVARPVLEQWQRDLLAWRLQHRDDSDEPLDALAKRLRIEAARLRDEHGDVPVGAFLIAYPARHAVSLIVRPGGTSDES